MQINKVQANNTNFTSIRFTKAAKNHIADTFYTNELKELGELVKEHEKISPDVVVGTTKNLLGSTRLRARIDGEEGFDNSLLFEEGFEFLQNAAEYAKDVYKTLGTSASKFMEKINK